LTKNRLTRLGELPRVLIFDNDDLRVPFRRIVIIHCRRVVLYLNRRHYLVVSDSRTVALVLRELAAAETDGRSAQAHLFEVEGWLSG